ncbi:MAG: 2-polyprenylphenol 6-hydroxylase [Magnetococcales bacterium]|nr:2-polyprenylphenol 6-hydroxylase [Magnetococcales bacterium]NGZ27809.1 2-polyprenylphenol 6-hydroxylase [Magnetococcales bacterium]
MLGVVARHEVLPMAEHYLPIRLLHWFFGMSPSVRRYRRQNSLGVRLREALEQLGPTFIKFGQALSTRMDALPDDIGQEMKKLQDAVPPFPFEQVRKTVEKNLGKSLEELFLKFDPEPVASASIAQVHHAITRDGHEVAVKVQRPGILEKVEGDIRVLFFLARIIENHIPDWERFRAKRVVDEFANTIREEMNFHTEASRAQQFYKNFRNDPVLQVPQVYWGLTSTRVLTMEWINGIPIDDLVHSDNKTIDPELVAKNVVTSFFKQVFRDGYFHADQHPGNIFVKPDGTIALLDFGIVSQVSIQTRVWLAEMLSGFLMRDYEKVARVHLDAGYITPETNMEEFEEACRQVGEPIFGQPLKQISVARLLAQLFKVTEQFQMVVQPQLLMLQKTLFTLEGVGREINPDLNVWLLAEPLVRDWMKENLGPRGKIRSFRRQMEHFSYAMTHFPDLAFDTLERLTHDRMQVRIHPASLDRLEKRINNAVQKQGTAIVGGSLFIGSAIMAAAHFSPFLFGPPMALGLFYALRGMRMLK